MDRAHKNDIPIHLGQVLKRQKILVSNILYHCLLAVSLGNKASKMPEKIRLDVKTVFKIRSTQNASIL